MKLLLSLLLLVAGNAFAQSWPTKPLRVIVTFSPGGSSDIVARLIAIPLQTELGQTVIIDNKQGLKMEHVGYKGSAPMHNDLLPGTIKLAIDTLPQNVPFIKDGRLRAIAVTSSARAPMTPEVPSVLEYGHKKLVAENFLGVSGPAGLPREVIARLHAAMKKSLADPKITQRLTELGVQGRDMTPEEFTAFVANQVRDWHQPVKDSGAKLN